MLPQKQAGYALVTATVPLGDLTAAQLRVLAELSQAYRRRHAARDASIRTWSFRWVKTSDVPEFYRHLAAAGLGLAGAGTIADVASCPGAESCRLAVTQSRGLGKTLETHLRAHPEIAAKAPDLKIKMSGCPNGCGQHHIAGLGFQGSIRKLGDRVVPQYFVMVGGGVDDQGATLRPPRGQGAGAPDHRTSSIGWSISTRDTHDDGESATAFFQRVEVGDGQDDARRPREARAAGRGRPTTSSTSARRRRSRRK